MDTRDPLRYRIAPLEMTSSEFRNVGRQLVERIAEFLCTLPDRPVAPNESPRMIREALGTGSLPEQGSEAKDLLEEAANLLFAHSTFNGHPRFWGVITSSAAPVGALGELLAASVNPNMGGWIGGPMANEIETHTWIHKATDMFGLGTEAIRWIPVNTQLRMDTTALRKQIQADIEAGDLPFLVIGTAGTVSTGAVDPLPDIAAICREYDLWFHVDGAYGGFAAMLLNDDQGTVPTDLQGIAEADSVAVDPHKWLYAPLEAGCTLVRKPEALRETFSYHPPYYHFVEEPSTIDYHEYGPQNSRGFRALKVWLALRQVGRKGYVEMLSDDIQLAQELYRLVEAHPELQAFTQALSITTFRYVPPDLTPGSQEVEAYLNQLNAELLTRLQRSGEAFLSNAVVRGTFLLRACIVNFRTSLEDVEALPVLVIRIGREVDVALRPVELNT